MEFSLRSFAAVAMLVSALIGSAVTQVTQDSQSACRVAGTVVDSVTQQPLGGSEVTLRGPMGSGSANWKSLSVTADAEGHFAFDGLSPGRYMVTAFHTGYVNMGPGRAGAHSRMAAVLTPGQSLDDFIVPITPGGTISGRVVSSSSKPLSQVTVQVLKHEYQAGRIELGEISSAQTNKAGEYRIVSLAPGKYFLRFLFLDPQPSKPGSDEAYIPTFYPGTPDQSQSVPVDLRAGEELGGMDMTLTARRTFSVRGRVLDSITKAPVPETEVNLVPTEGIIFPSPYHATTDVKGNFEIHGLPASEYVATAENDEGSKSNTRRCGQKPVRIRESSVDGLEILIARGVEVSGRIHFDGKTNVDLSSMTGSLEATENWASQFTGEIDDAHVRSDGSFIFYDVPEGSYRISFSPAPPGFYVKAGGTAIEDLTITVSRGSPVRALDFTLSPGSTSIQGTAVSEQQPAPGVAVLLVPNGERRSQYRFYKRVSADRQGKFQMQALIPGDYKIFAFEEMRRGAMMDPDFLAEYESNGKEVTLKEGETADVQVDVIPQD